jgi:hypothetical protein
MKSWLKYFLWLYALCWFNTIPSWAQEPITNPPPSEVKTSSKSIDLKVGEVLRVKVPQLPSNPTGKIAVWLGNIDITSQIEIDGDELVYRSSLIPLNIGEQTLTVYQLQSEDRWDTLATFQLKVNPNLAQASTPSSSISESAPTPETKPSSSTPETTPPATETKPSSSTSETTPSATETKPSSSTSETTPPAAKPNFTVIPKFSINLKSQLLENRSPDAGVSQRPTFVTGDFTGGLSSEYKIDKATLKSKFTIVGTTFQPEALRFGEIQERASQIDLSEYAVEFSDENNQFAIGNLCFGNHPFLLNNLCTRGLSAKVKLDRFSDLSVARLSSTSVVGFENIFGLDRNENTLESAILGLQIAENQNAGVRLETTWMTGSRAPVANFNVGEIVDAEKSSGVGVRLTGGDDTGRLKADAGFANSTFTSLPANDPELSEGLNDVPLEPANKNAWYAEASYDLLKDIKLDRDRTLSASINFRTERIDPQFGTLGASLQADRLETQYALNMNIAGATVQLQQSFSNNNIANIPTLLKTDNRNTNINLTFPLQTFLQNKNQLLPTITYGIQQTKQLGSIAAVVDGGFNNPAQIPDQFNTTHQVGLDWTVGDVNFNYKYASALQDNRQVGQENADTRNITHQFSTSWQASPQLRFNLGYNLVNADDLGQQITRFTQSPTVGVSWEFIPGTLFAFNYNRSDDSDSIGQAFNRGESLEFLLTWNFKINSLGQEIPGSTFIRYGKQSTLNQNRGNNVNTNASIDTISAGLSLSF